MEKGSTRFTVLLAYPEDMTDSRLETYAAWVYAADADGAVRSARRKVGKANGLHPDYWGDFRVIAAYAGHLTDINPEPLW